MVFIMVDDKPESKIVKERIDAQNDEYELGGETSKRSKYNRLLNTDDPEIHDKPVGTHRRIYQVSN